MILTLLLHAVYATIISLILAHLFGSLGTGIVLMSLVLGYFVGKKHARALLAIFPDWKILGFKRGEAGAVEALMSVFILFAAFRHFAWMMYPNFHEWWTLSVNNFGDLPLHINFIRALASGIEFPVHNPIFASELLRYPYGSDLYNALWELLGVNLRAHLFIVGMCATAVSLVLLRSYAGWWGIGAFFLSGGLAGWQMLGGAPNSAEFQTQVAWKNMFLAVFVTQRGMLFALPMGLIMLKMYREHCSRPDGLGQRPLTILGILWGFMPVFHLHSFLILSIMMLGISFEYRGARAGLARFFRERCFAIAFVPASIAVLHSSNYFSAGQVAHLHFGWTYENGSVWRYLIDNFGPWLFVPALIAVSLAFAKDIFDAATRRRLWFELALSSFLFVLFFNVILAPWDWDNIKLLIWPYLGFARLLSVILEPRMGTAFGVIERPIVATTLFLSGLVAVTWTLGRPEGRAVQLYPISHLASSEGALSGIPQNAVFASATTHQHPLGFFGRSRAVGYLGHLWSHGIDSKQKQSQLERLMKGDEDFVALARELGISHIFWGPDERKEFGDGFAPWMRVWPNVSRVPEYDIYAVPN